MLGDGQRVRYYSIDGAGNAEAVRTSSAAQVDKQSPVTTDDVPSGFQQAPVTVTLTVDEQGGSGLDTTYYTTNGSNPTLPSNPARRIYDPNDKPVLGDGQSLRYYSTDLAGNAETVKLSLGGMALRVNDARR